MNDLQEHLDLLGRRVRDRVTGATGVVESISYDLYGCIQAVVRSAVSKDGSVPDGRWFDVARLELENAKAQPVMPRPAFVSASSPLAAAGQRGPADKPLPR